MEEERRRRTMVVDWMNQSITIYENVPEHAVIEAQEWYDDSTMNWSDLLPNEEVTLSWKDWKHEEQ